MSETAPSTPNIEAEPNAEPSAAAALHMLPAQIFFTELIDAPEELDGEEIDALVELEIEQSSPFPIDQLIWGWRLINDGATILTFATTLEKAKAFGASEFDSPHLPILAPFAACDYAAEGITQIIFRGAHFDAVAVAYDGAGKAIEVEGFALDESARPDDFASQAEALLDSVNTPTFQQIYLGTPSRDESTGLVWPKYDSPESSEDAEPIHTTELDAPRAWYVDLRDRGFKTSRQQELNQSNRIWKSISVVVVVALAMLGLEVVQWSVRGFLDLRSATLMRQEPLVQRLDQQQGFLHKMSDIEEAQMRPFAVLAILNENRPDKIHFLRAEAIDSTQYEIQAQGTAVTEVNNYVATYQGHPAFTNVEHTITGSRSGRVLFDLSITLGTLPEIAPLSPVQEPTENEEEGDES